MPCDCGPGRWAIQRASQLDVESIAKCRGLLTSLNGKLLEFEFRNGNLRSVSEGLPYIHILCLWQKGPSELNCRGSSR